MNEQPLPCCLSLLIKSEYVQCTYSFIIGRKIHFSRSRRSSRSRSSNSRYRRAVVVVEVVVVAVVILLVAAGAAAAAEEEEVDVVAVPGEAADE